MLMPQPPVSATPGPPAALGGTPSAGRSTIHAPRGGIKKPYASYKPPPPVSPYMGLYRTDNSLGTIDNYNQFVRPKLDQQARRQQLNNQLRTLQTTAQRQGAAIRGLDRRRGTATPQYYMNYRSYYPGFPTTCFHLDQGMLFPQQRETEKSSTRLLRWFSPALSHPTCPPPVRKKRRPAQPI